MSECPSLDRWELLADGASDAVEAGALTAHAASCPQCAEALARVRQNLAVTGTVADALRARAAPPGSGPLGLVGRSFDGYSIVRVLGSGSSSTVYEAVQHHPRRSVAIKVLSAFASGAEHTRRFDHEARILSRLRHPGIAAVYACGTLEDDAGSRPYIAMELVAGSPITDHARGASLNVQARLDLLAQACDAVQHAHEQGVVHRDLKPANILVTSAGVVRVVDFGIARAAGSWGGAEAGNTLTTMHTATGQIVGTVAYMSPEHVASASAVDARSDVYSLGVVGFEVLTDRLPLPIGGKSLEAALRFITLVEPARPSTIRPGLPAPLDTVLLRAMEKDPAARYPTAGGLGADLRRVIADEPIGAEPPSVTQRARKFARRNRALVVGASCVIVALLLGLAGTTYGLIRAVERTRVAEERRRDAEQLTGLMEQMLHQAHPHEAKGRTYTVRQMLDDFSRRFGDGLADQPTVDAALRTTMGTGYRVLGEYALARPHLERAVALRRAAQPVQPAILASALCDLAMLEHDEGGYDSAIAWFREAHSLASAGPGAVGAVGVRAAMGESDCLRHLGRFEEATVGAARAVAGASIGGADSLLSAEARMNLSRVLREAGDRDGAQRELDIAMAHFNASLGSADPRMADALNDAAWLAFLNRDTALAERTARAALDVGTASLGPAHPDVANSKYELAMIIAGGADDGEGERLMREALAIYEAAHGPNHPSTFTAQEALARILRQAGRPAEALPLLQASIAGRRTVFGESHLEVGYSLSALGQVQRDLGDRAGAAASLNAAIAIYRASFGKPHAFIANAQRELAGLASDAGDLDEAQRLYEEVVATSEAAVGPAHADTLNFLGYLGVTHEKRGDWDGAMTVHERVVERCTPATPAHRLPLARQGIGRCLTAMGRAPEAVPILREVLGAFDAAANEPGAPPHVRKRAESAREDLGAALVACGDHDGAAALKAAATPTPPPR